MIREDGKVAQRLHERYIKGSHKEAIVQNVQVLLCHLTKSVMKGADIKADRVYINTRALKHTYDKRTAQEYDFLIAGLYKIVKYPHKIYKNKRGKRGSYGFVRNVEGRGLCFCSLEFIEDGEKSRVEIATFFHMPKPSYLDNYTLLWSWEDGDLHRSAFDSGINQPSSTPQ